MSTQLNCGYVPLVDSAPLIVAQDMRFAADEGIELNLRPQPSWSALRDLLALGHLDAAHMLSPMPAAMSLGLSGAPAQVDALVVLSANGTVIGVSSQMADAMRAKGWHGGFDDPAGTATPLLNALDRPLRVGVPFPYSMHRLLFEYWIDAGGQNPFVPEIITTPPPYGGCRRFRRVRRFLRRRTVGVRRCQRRCWRIDPARWCDLGKSARKGVGCAPTLD